MNHSLTKEELHKDQRTVLGFWLYLMTDLILFASLFATFAVLRGDGSYLLGLFDMPLVLAETLLLLASSISCGLAIYAVSKSQVQQMFAWLTATFVLGAAFLSIELSEFARLVASGNGPNRNGQLSAYFTLVGTHGIHIAIGLLWLLIMMVAIVTKGLSRANMRKLLLWSMFWHFLDIVWIFIFTIVYLLGV